MPTRLEIELTSTAGDGSWTWRAAGAKNPRGVLDGSILPTGAAVGSQYRVEAEQGLDGIQVTSVLPPKEKAARELLELLPSDKPFEPVVEHRASRGRRDGDRSRGPRRDGDQRGDRRDGGPRRDGDQRGDARGPRRDGDQRGDSRGPRRDGDQRGGAPEGGERRGGWEGRGGDRRGRPHFTPPPEIPQRPRPKRLRPGKAHRSEVLASLPEEQRPIAELALQGLAAVRQRLREDNVRLKAEGKPEMPEAAVLKMAEDLIPRLRVADWLDRADAAKRQMEHLDLRDLRSVVAAADDPVVARAEATRELAASLKQSLVTKQDEELTLWLGDVEAALEVGRVVRALRLSSQPPKAGVPFPGPLAARLGEATTQSLLPTDGPERWIAVLEAAAFSPVRALVTPAAAPEQPAAELVATVKRLGPLLPHIAALFGVEVRADASAPKPLRPTAPKKPAKAAAKPIPKPPKTAPRAARAGSADAPDAAAEVATSDASEVTEVVEAAETTADAETIEPAAAETVEPAAEVASAATETAATADASVSASTEAADTAASSDAGNPDG